MQVTRATFIPLLTSAHSDRIDPAAVREEAFGELTVVYTYGPDFGRRVVTHADLDQLQLPPRVLRQSALQHLEVLSSRAEFHGQPPALMLSFEGLESSLLLATDFWSRLEGAVPGELVVGVPARDVVIVTGSQSVPGMEKAKRCVERVFFAGGENLVSRQLMVRRGGTWEPFGGSRRSSGRPTFGPAHQHGVTQPPRQYQEHPSWPGGERVPVQQVSAPPRMGPGGPVPPPRRRPTFPMHPVAPAAQMAPPVGGMVPRPGNPMDTTGSHRFDSTGSHQFDLTTTGQQRFDTTGSQRFDTTGQQRFDTTGSQRAVRPEPAYRDWAAEVAEAAQYSAVPYSSLPYSGAPYPMSPAANVAPASAVPYSAMPYASPVSAPTAREATGSWYPVPDGYREDTYSTGPMPRSTYSDYAPSSDMPAPSYPGSWGTAPADVAPGRPEFRSGPRARFSR